MATREVPPGHYFRRCLRDTWWCASYTLKITVRDGVFSGCVIRCDPGTRASPLDMCKTASAFICPETTDRDDNGETMVTATGRKRAKRGSGDDSLERTVSGGYRGREAKRRFRRAGDINLKALTVRVGQGRDRCQRPSHGGTRKKKGRNIKNACNTPASKLADWTERREIKRLNIFFPPHPSRRYAPRDCRISGAPERQRGGARTRAPKGGRK